MSFAVPTDFSNTKNANFEPVPADNHVGVCVGLIDLGTHVEQFPGEAPRPVRKVKIQFELPGVTRDDGKAGIISSTLNYSLNEKANFRKMLDGWLGADWTERSKGKSWDFLIGTPAMVNVEQKDDKHNPGRKYSFVAGVSKFPKGMPAPKPTREPFWLDLSEKRLPETLSPWDAATIRKSAEYLAGGFTDEAPKPDAKAPYQPANNGNGANPRQQPVGPAPANARPCPPEIAPVLARLKMHWPFRVDDYPDAISDADLAALEPYAVPF